MEQTVGTRVPRGDELDRFATSASSGDFVTARSAMETRRRLQFGRGQGSRRRISEMPHVWQHDLGAP